MNTTDINIKHLASIARSGETFLLRCLSAHPEIIVFNNLLPEDSQKSLLLVENLRMRKHRTITSAELRKFDIDTLGKKRLVVKQGVWKHPYPFDGFILVRNPFSIYCSLKLYDSNEPWYDLENNFWKVNEDRIVRWLSLMNPELARKISHLSPVEQFCDFYNYRINDLLSNELPVIRYEDLVSSPEREMRRICDAIEVDFYPSLMNSHLKYNSGTFGHGKNDLSRAIDQSSINKCSGILADREFDIILKNTDTTLKTLNYNVTGRASNVAISW